MPDVVEQCRQVGGVEGAVAVHERDVLRRRGLESRVHRRAVSALALDDDRGAVASCDSGGVVAGVVVDDDHPVGGRHPREQVLQRRTLVEAREDEVARGFVVHVFHRRETEATWATLTARDFER